jgi:acyl phosphate:glycerol-3-phosphate acyltransferase
MLISILILIFSYLIGSIPSGLLIVRLKTGKDIRTVESGRTGGTNAMRAAGFSAGLATAILDILKGLLCAYLARFLAPGNVWVQVLAPVLAVIGHNYSVFLIERTDKGLIRFRGGAGGAPAMGGGTGLWFPVLIIGFPIGALILYFVGYASVVTLSVPVIITLIFILGAYIGAIPWQYIFYGLITFVVLAWALRPNIRRLINGNERLVGYRAKRKAKKQNQSAL